MALNGRVLLLNQTYEPLGTVSVARAIIMTFKNTVFVEELFKQRNPKARLACIDVQPYRTVQAAEREDILNVGGFSDQVFAVISGFARGELNGDHWIGVIESVAL